MYLRRKIIKKEPVRPRDTERKKKQEWERTKCTKRKTDGIWVPHGESTRTPHRKPLHLPFLCLNHSNSFILSFILFSVSQRERARVRRTHGTNTPQKCYGKDRERMIMNILSWFTHPHSSISFFQEKSTIVSALLHTEKTDTAKKEHLKAMLKWFIWQISTNHPIGLCEELTTFLHCSFQISFMFQHIQILIESLISHWYVCSCVAQW